MKEIEVPQDEGFIRASKEYNHLTYGMGPCIGIGIYDIKSGESYLVHMAYIYKNFEDDIKQISQKLDHNNTQIYLCGGGHSQFHNEDMRKNIKNSRLSVKKTLESCFPKENIQTKWSELDYTADLLINKKTKEFEHKTYDTYGNQDNDSFYQDYDYDSNYNFY